MSVNFQRKEAKKPVGVDSVLGNHHAFSPHETSRRSQRDASLRCAQVAALNSGKVQWRTGKDWLVFHPCLFKNAISSPIVPEISSAATTWSENIYATPMFKHIGMGLRSFFVFAAKIWSFICYCIRRQIRAVIQHQTVKYEILPLSPMSRHRLNMVKRKTMVLDLDETLIHSHHDGVLRQTVKPGTPPDFVLKVIIDRHPVRFFVHKRPHVDFFLDMVSRWYDLVVFTASMEIYGAAVADTLDSNRGILKRRYYRQHCNLDYGSYTKDLSAISSDLASIFILDNSPGAYRSYPDNAIPIKSWFSDPTDTALLNLLPVLDALRFSTDVRSVLNRNLHLHRLWQ